MPFEKTKVILTFILFLFTAQSVLAQEYVSAYSNPTPAALYAAPPQQSSGSVGQTPQAQANPTTPMPNPTNPSPSYPYQTQPAVPQQNVPIYAAPQPVNPQLPAYPSPPAQPPAQTVQQNSIPTYSSGINTNNAPQLANQFVPNPNVTSDVTSENPQNPQSSRYTDAEKQAWFKSCLNAVSHKKAANFANEFCNCGWIHITSGQLPPELLESITPESNKKRNDIMHVISQQCVVELMTHHNL